VVVTLREGFQKLQENAALLKKKRKFEGASYVLEWKSTGRPPKFPCVKIADFKEWFSFKVTDRSKVEVSRPLIELESSRSHPYYKVKEVGIEWDEVKFRRSERTEKRKSVLSTFRERRQQEIATRRNLPPSLGRIACFDPMN